jgi:sec-independent protein translocase protein TatA
MSFGPLEIILVLVVVALIFGAKKLPELGKGLGLGIKEFKKETREPVPPPHATTPVTDVQVRPLDPVAGAPMTTEVTQTADGRVVETVTERDHRA